MMPAPLVATSSGEAVRVLVEVADVLQLVGSSPELICRGGWPSLVGHLQSLPKDVGKFRDHV